MRCALAGVSRAPPSILPGTSARRAATAAMAQPEAAGVGQIVLQYEALVPAVLLKRYKRFLGDVHLGDPAAAAASAAMAAAAAGEASQPPTVVHVPNTGSMCGLLDALPAPALLSVSADPKRKYAHTLEALQVEGAWVCAHSAKANSMARFLLEARALPHLPPYTRIQQEVKFGADGKSRVDFVLHNEAGGSSSNTGSTEASSSPAPAKRKRGGGAAAVTPASTSCCYLEVKASTLAEDRPGGGGRIALFPDCVSDRAQRHVRELTAVARRGGAAALLFVVLRGDCAAFAPAHEKDPVYGRLVREAAEAGVRFVAVACACDPATSAVRFRGVLPLDLDYKWAG